MIYYSRKDVFRVTWRLYILGNK